MKYEGNKAVVDEPSVWTISDGTVKVKRAEGIDSYTYEGDLTIQFGDLQAWAPANIDPVEVTPIEPTPDSGGGDNPGGDSGGDNPGGESGGETPGGEDNPGGDTPDTPVTGNESYATSGTPGTIGFNIINRSGQDLYYSGSLRLQIKQGSGQNAWNSQGTLVSTGKQVDWPLNPPTDRGEPYQGYYFPHYWSNNRIAAGSSKLFTMSSFKTYEAGTNGVKETDVPLSTYCDGNWYFVTSDNPGYTQSNPPGTGGIAAIFIGTAIQTDSTTKTNNGFCYSVSPVRQSDSHIET